MTRSKHGGKQSIERDLRLAINPQQIEAHFQPVVELQGRRIIGFEALMRWNHPQHGPISPPEIVDVASEIGMVQQPTRCIALNCFEMIERLTSCGPHNLVVAMNLSPRKLPGGRTSREILSDRKNRQLPWHMFGVEITEHAPFDQYDVDQGLNLLATSGVSVALDDFGTGFATFASLKNGVIRKIKIDQLFVRGISRSVRDQNLVRAIAELDQALDIEVTAEGIECAENCRTLLRLGSTRGQGFLISPALPMERAIEMLKQCPFLGAPLHQQAVRRRAENIVPNSESGKRVATDLTWQSRSGRRLDPARSRLLKPARVDGFPIEGADAVPNAQPTARSCSGLRGTSCKTFRSDRRPAGMAARPLVPRAIGGRLV